MVVGGGKVTTNQRDRWGADFQRRRAELEARLAELEARRRALLDRLEQLWSQNGGSRETAGGVPGPLAAARVGPLLVTPEGEAPAGRKLPAGREEELDYCLRLLKLRCQMLAEALAEVMMLAEALHALARPAPPGSGAAAEPAAGRPATGVPPQPPAAPPAGGAPPEPAPTPPPAAGPGRAPSPDSLAGILASPQFQKLAAQLLTQLLKK